MLMLLNLLFFVGHDLLIAFNLFGWVSSKTRKWHLVTMGATLFSWLVMGAWRGWGYCVCTDAHFRIRRELGIHSGESSYVQLMLNRIPGVDASRSAADTLAVGCLLTILASTACVWIVDWRKRPTGGQKAAISADDEP